MSGKSAGMLLLFAMSVSGLILLHYMGEWENERRELVANGVETAIHLSKGTEVPVDQYISFRLSCYRKETKGELEQLLRTGEMPPSKIVALCGGENLVVSRRQAVM